LLGCEHFLFFIVEYGITSAVAADDKSGSMQQ
jgi:hypothetical protein